MVVARGRARPPRTTNIPPSGGAAVAVGKADGGVEQQQAAPSGVSHGGGITPNEQQARSHASAAVLAARAVEISTRLGRLTREAPTSPLEG